MCSGTERPPRVPRSAKSCVNKAVSVRKPGPGSTTMRRVVAAPPSEQVADIVRGFARRSGQTQRAFGPPDEIVDRLMAALVNEGAKLLDEGIATRGSDIDVVWVHGYGFPRHRGRTDVLRRRAGVSTGCWLPSRSWGGFPNRSPPPLLTRLVSEGGRLATYERGSFLGGVALAEHASQALRGEGGVLRFPAISTGVAGRRAVRGCPVGPPVRARR